jgi:CDP-4-dehydro-6-deoxyglucose reductase, E1
MKLDIPLMQNNITSEDFRAMIEFLKDEPILTNSKKCMQFEEEWSKWLGVKYSVFVNSGSSANILTLAVLHDLVGDGEVIVPPLTWISDIISVIKAGFTPVFVDINRSNLGMNDELIIKALTPKTKAVFLTHILGFNALTDRLLSELQKRNIPLIEDVCESHGATFHGEKLGTFGLVSNFSFYFAHHLSTIEGGMVCTNDEKIYQMARMYRAHGMTREMTNQGMKDEYIKHFPDLRPEFIFAHPGYNFRSTEINGVIGLSQLPRLDGNNVQRRRNFDLFLKNIDPKKYVTEFDTEGSSNYAFVLLLRKPDTEFCNRVMATLKEHNVEYRRGTSGGGNQLRQPYLKKLLGSVDLSKFPEVDYVHFFGFYIGNYPSLEEEKILKLCEILNEVN